MAKVARNTTIPLKVVEQIEKKYGRGMVQRAFIRGIELINSGTVEHVPQEMLRPKIVRQIYYDSYRDDDVLKAHKELGLETPFSYVAATALYTALVHGIEVASATSGGGSFQLKQAPSEYLEQKRKELEKALGD